MSDFIAWALERWPFAVIVLLALGFLYGGLVFEIGSPIIRPVSAQTMQQQITAAKAEMAQSVSGIQKQLKDISDKQDTMQKVQHDDQVARLEQQLLWWRQQNCKSKGQARNYAWDKLDDLRKDYRKLLGTEWPMPTCSDIGD